MKKRGLFLMVILTLCIMNMYAAKDYTDLGVANTLTITEDKPSEAGANTASTVTVIDQQQIKTYQAETTADLIGKAIGTEFKSYGAVGALQNVSIRGMGSARTQVYLDGMPLSSAHDSCYDLSTIPVSIIDHIEIIKNGTGNLGDAVAFGGIVNIVTKKASPDEKGHYEISAENGSFLPKKYTDGTETKQSWRSLADSQKLDFTYTNNIGGISLLANIGGYYAANQYTYTESNVTSIRKNAGAWGLHGGLNVNGTFGEDGTYTSNNLFSYQNLRIPGSTTYASPENYQKTLSLSTANAVQFKNIAVNAGYEYSPLNYHSEGTNYLGQYTISDSEHKKHKAYAKVGENWKISDTISLKTTEAVTLDYVDSTDAGKNTRFEPKLGVSGAFYFLDGKLSLHPAVTVSYLSDMKQVSPNGSVGVVYTILKDFDAKATVSYAENAPTFSQLFWPGYCNPDLKTEKAVSGEAGLSYANDLVSYDGSVFARYITNAIVNDASWTPQNISQSAWFGTEQAVTVTPIKGLSLTASYLLNKSYDLSDGKKLSDNQEVSGIRKHTVKFAASYVYKMFSFSVDGSYTGKTTYGNTEMPAFWLLNANVQAQVTDGLSIYAAIDNLLDTSYYYVTGYPMPGLKIRLGGTWKF